jgi:antitoxin component YwqK of YwqJK toxin-antitoxin module
LLERDGLYYEKFTEKPFTGKVTGIKQGKIQKGKIEGKWIEYYNNGQLKEKRNYKDGKLIKTLTHK